MPPTSPGQAPPESTPTAQGRHNAPEPPAAPVTDGYTLDAPPEAAPPRIESVFYGRDPALLRQLLAFYAKPGARILDATANARRMWSGVETDPRPVFLDLDPSVQPDVVGDFRAMPFEPESFDVIVFDPPHLPASQTTAGDEGFGKRFGLGLSELAWRGASPYFAPFLAEAARVLRRDGLVFAKLKDFINGREHVWTLVDFINAVRATPGMTPCDVVVKRDPAGGTMSSSTWKRANHARNVHCWWVVVRKGGCEPRGAR